MGRKKKQKQNNYIGITVLFLLLLVYAKIMFFPDFNPFKDIDFKNPFNKRNIEVSTRSVEEDYTEVNNEDVKMKDEEIFVNIFFSRISSGKDVYVAVSRKKPENYKGSDVEFAIKMLLNGPTKAEKAQGAYTEIPSGTKLLWYKETPSKVIINLSDDFEFGGGGDSIYKRMYQLIKTANHNTRKPVYLYIKGKQANMIGGEGLMLKQPLRSNSLDE